MRYPKKGYPKRYTQGVRNLPVFKGYFVDARLKQFRRVDIPALTDEEGVEEYYEGISFDSDKGQELLAEIDNMAECDHNMELLSYEAHEGYKSYKQWCLLDWGPPVGSLGTS
jgi:hypothetical protein